MSIQRTEAMLRNIIDEAVNDTLMREGHASDRVKKITKRAGNALRKGYKKTKDFLNKEYDKINNAPNPFYDGDDELDENRLRRIVAESVKMALREGKMGTTRQDLEQVRDIVKDIIDSSFIPFTSPAPSSTEKELKDTIINVAREIDHALYLYGTLYGGQQPFHIA